MCVCVCVCVCERETGVGEGVVPVIVSNYSAVSDSECMCRTDDW